MANSDDSAATKAKDETSGGGDKPQPKAAAKPPKARKGKASRKKAAGKRRITTAGSPGDQVNVKSLRTSIGTHFGGKPVSRNYVADLAGISTVTLTAWEKDKSKTTSPKGKTLRDLATRVSAGDFSGLPVPKKPGRQPKAQGGRPKGPGRGARTPKAPARTAGRLSADELVDALLLRAEASSDPKLYIAVINDLRRG